MRFDPGFSSLRNVENPDFRAQYRNDYARGQNKENWKERDTKQERKGKEMIVRARI